MKISKSQLRTIIKEELEKTINEVGAYEHGDESLVQIPKAELQKAMKMLQTAQQTGNDNILSQVMTYLNQKLSRRSASQYNVAEEISEE